MIQPCEVLELGQCPTALCGIDVRTRLPFAVQLSLESRSDLTIGRDSLTNLRLTIPIPIIFKSRVQGSRDRFGSLLFGIYESKIVNQKRSILWDCFLISYRMFSPYLLNRNRLWSVSLAAIWSSLVFSVAIHHSLLFQSQSFYTGAKKCQCPGDSDCILMAAGVSDVF
jgi:hypothetical protein